MSRLLSASILLFAFLTPTMSLADEVPQTFSFQGSGYGHGVGMSQIGARGQALEGKSATDIVKYYYKDVLVEPVVDSQFIRVNIGHLLTGLSLLSDTKLGQVQLFSSDMDTSTTASPDLTVPAKTNISFSLLGNSMIATATYANGRVDALASAKAWTIRWSGTRSMQGPDAVLAVKIGASSTQYRYGQIQIKLVKAAAVGYRIEVTNTLRLHDEYLWGIGEVPSSWPIAALQAQAIASRSFALSKVGKMRVACDCEIYSSTQDQSFVGYSKELEKGWGSIWKGAVSSTSEGDEMGLTLTYASQPIAAYFFSSSSGQTVLAQDVWGAPVPYTVSVADSWSTSPVLNPRYFHWERAIDRALVAQAFGLPDVARMEIGGHFESGTVSVIIATSSTGLRAQLSGETFRSKVKLPSAWFDFLGPQMSDANSLPKPVRTIFHSL